MTAVHRRIHVPITVFVAALLFTTTAVAQSLMHTPKSGSPERKEIMDALRVPVQRELHQEVKFVISTLNVLNGWAFLSGVPQQKNGKPVDYSITKYASDVDEGFFDDGIVALLRYSNGRWGVTAYAIGCTDVCYEDWPNKYRAPHIIFR